MKGTNKMIDTPAGLKDVREADSTWLDSKSPEWAYAWGRIKEKFGDTAQLNDNEVWQYMGTWKREGAWVHSFRHRNHPDGNRRAYCHVPVSATWAVLLSDEPEDESLLGPID